MDATVPYLNPREPETVQHFLCIIGQPMFHAMDSLVTFGARSPRSIKYEDGKDRNIEQSSASCKDGRQLRVLGLPMTVTCTIDPAAEVTGYNHRKSACLTHTPDIDPDSQCPDPTPIIYKTLFNRKVVKGDSFSMRLE